MRKLPLGAGLYLKWASATRSLARICCQSLAGMQQKKRNEAHLELHKSISQMFIVASAEGELANVQAIEDCTTLIEFEGSMRNGSKNSAIFLVTLHHRLCSQLAHACALPLRWFFLDRHNVIRSENQTMARIPSARGSKSRILQRDLEIFQVLVPNLFLKLCSPYAWPLV